MNNEISPEMKQINQLNQTILRLKAEVYDANADSSERDRRYQQLLNAIFQVIDYKPGPNGFINADEVLQTLKAKVVQPDAA